MVIIFILNLQNRKLCEVIVHYLAETNAFDDFSQTVYADDNTPNATGHCIKKVIGSRESFENIVSYVQFVTFNPWKVLWNSKAFY